VYISYLHGPAHFTVVVVVNLVSQRKPRLHILPDVPATGIAPLETLPGEVEQVKVRFDREYQINSSQHNKSGCETPKLCAASLLKKLDG